VAALDHAQHRLPHADAVQHIQRLALGCLARGGGHGGMAAAHAHDKDKGGQTQQQLQIGAAAARSAAVADAADTVSLRSTLMRSRFEAMSASTAVPCSNMSDK
jgi:hypothetical protein